MSRELDVKVAEAMGWTRIRMQNGRGVGCSPSQGPFFDPCEEVPGYSTDFSALPEMLDWITKQGWCVRHWGRGGVDDPIEEWETSDVADEMKVRTVWMAVGKWPEAVARLVVAVAEAKQ